MLVLGLQVEVASTILRLRSCVVGRPADLESLCHDAAHDGTDPQRALHVQFAQGRFELVDGNQPGSDGRRGRAQQVQLPANATQRSF